MGKTRRLSVRRVLIWVSECGSGVQQPHTSLPSEESSSRGAARANRSSKMRRGLAFPAAADTIEPQAAMNNKVCDN